MAVQFPTLRDFQARSHQALRQGFKDGHKNQLIMASTGAGKTLLAMWIIHEALQKGRRAVFVCDRTALINQTSAVADSLGLSDHAIIQAQHPRRDTSRPLQIASIQTIAKRGFWPDADVIIIDEAHAQYSAWVEHAKKTKAVCIGLSATPFSKGLGKIFTNLINVTSMHELTQTGILVPMKVFSCTQMDMKGADKDKGGEWTERAAEQRGKAIIGDVVSEWLKLSSERKTIVFGATIKHCEEMCAKFLDAGVMAAVYTSETKADEREVLLKEFKKPDSVLRVLITVEALAKGYDESSVSCIATGSRVLTDRGLVPIEQVEIYDKLWDGHEWVTHGGIVYKGEKDVITYAGLTATNDHLVKTKNGWTTFEECHNGSIGIATTGDGGLALWESENHFTGSAVAKNKQGCEPEGSMRVHGLRRGDLETSQGAERGCCVPEVFARKRYADLDSAARSEHAGSLYQSVKSSLRKLWRKGHRVQVSICQSCSGLGGCESWGCGSGCKHPVGPERQRWSLRAWESSLGNQVAQLRKYATRWLGGHDSQIQDRPSGNSLFRQDSTESIYRRGDDIADRREVSPKVHQTQRGVWDILNAGPRNSFTCEGLLVHNCVVDCRPLSKSLSTAIQMWGRGLRSHPGKVDCRLHDHSGNIVRMAEDFTDIYFNGLAALDDGEKLDKKQRDTEDEQPKDSACPACGYTPFHKRCMACGHEKHAPSPISHEPGEMREITIGKGKNQTKLADDHKHLWEQLASYARIHSAPEKQPYRAKHLFNKIAGFNPPSEWAFSITPDVPVTDGVHRKIRAINIAFARGTGK